MTQIVLNSNKSFASSNVRIRGIFAWVKAYHIAITIFECGLHLNDLNFLKGNKMCAWFFSAACTLWIYVEHFNWYFVDTSLTSITHRSHAIGYYSIVWC